MTAKERWQLTIFDFWVTACGLKIVYTMDAYGKAGWKLVPQAPRAS